MTHNDHHAHPVLNGFVLFGVAASILGWSIFACWTMMEQLLDVVRK